MFALFICYNPISYHIAQRVIRRNNVPRAIVLWDAKRFPRPSGTVGWHLTMGARSHQVIHALSSMGCVSRVYVPHMRVTIRRLQLALSHVAEVHYLDDGLDTLRRIPKNFDVDSLVVGRSYYTFQEYELLPEWLSQLNVCKLGHLADLQLHDRSGMPFPSGAHVLIESPGVQVTSLVDKLLCDGVKPILVRHPASAKRTMIDARKVQLWQGSGNLDADIKRTEGAHFYIGETMSLVMAMHNPSRTTNTWHLCLDKQQRENLVFLDAPLLASHLKAN